MTKKQFAELQDILYHMLDPMMWGDVKQVLYNMDYLKRHVKEQN